MFSDNWNFVDVSCTNAFGENRSELECHFILYIGHINVEDT